MSFFVFTSFIFHRTGTALPDDNGRTLGVTTAPLFLLRFIMHRTGAALPDDNGRVLVTTAPWSRGRETTRGWHLSRVVK
jgi:hypothetical protein